jgi:hypothetical protein
MLIGSADMPLDMQQHIEVMSGTLLLIVVILHRLLKRKGLGNLRLTVSVTEENSNDCHPNTNSSEADGQRMDSNERKLPHTKQQKKQ